MDNWDKIPEPVNFNPLKHHMGYIRSFSSKYSVMSEDKIKKDVVPVLRHLGTSVADIYTGELDLEDIIEEISHLRVKENVVSEQSFLEWIGKTKKGYRKCSLSDSSQWVIKYLDDNVRYFHIFPGRNLDCTIRSRGNTLKTAILFDILYDKGDILLTDLNSVRSMLGLSPLRSIESASGIISDIRMLQSS